MVKYFIILIMSFNLAFSASITKEELPKYIAEMYLFFQLDENDERYKEYFSDIMDGINKEDFYNSIYGSYFPAGAWTYNLSYKNNKDFALPQKKYFDKRVDKYLENKYSKNTIPSVVFGIIGWILMLGFLLYVILEMIYKFKIFRFVMRKL